MPGIFLVTLIWSRDVTAIAFSWLIFSPEGSHIACNMTSLFARVNYTTDLLGQTKNDLNTTWWANQVTIVLYNKSQSLCFCFNFSIPVSKTELIFRLQFWIVRWWDSLLSISMDPESLRWKISSIACEALSSQAPPIPEKL